MNFSNLDKHRDKGLLLLRIGIGIMFMFHGYPKLAGGPEVWSKIGSVLSMFGLGFAPTVMGFMAAVSQFFGGLLLMLGLFTRIASFFLFSTMAVASLMHITKGDSFNSYSHAVESAILFFSFIIIASGKYSLDEKFFSKNKRE